MSVSDYVIKMRVFDASGELRTYTPDSQAMFRAVIASFGCFGVVYDITLKVQCRPNKGDNFLLDRLHIISVQIKIAIFK